MTAKRALFPVLTAALCAVLINVPVFANIRTTGSNVQADLKTAYISGGKGKNYAADKDKKKDDNPTLAPGRIVYFSIQGAKTDDDMIGSRQLPLLTDSKYYTFSSEVLQGKNLVESIELVQKKRSDLETFSNRDDTAWYLAVKVKNTCVGKSDPVTVRFMAAFTATQSGARQDKTPISKAGCSLILEGRLLLEDDGDSPQNEQDAGAAFADRSYGSSSGYAKFSAAKQADGSDGIKITWTVDNSDDPHDGEVLAEVVAGDSISASFRPKLDAELTRKQKTAFRNVQAILRGFGGNCALPGGTTAQLTLYNPFMAQNAEDVHIYQQSGDLFLDVTDRFSRIRQGDNFIFRANVDALGVYILSDEKIG